jgi:spermidine synthase
VIGQADPIQIDIDKMQAKLDSPAYAITSKSLQEIGFHSAVDLLATYAGRPSDLQQWLKGAVITHDRDMRIQYLAGMSLNLYHADDIYKSMVKYGPYMPKEMFTGGDVHLQLLDQAITQGLSR